MAKINRVVRTRFFKTLFFGAAAASSFGFVTQDPLTFWPVGDVEWKLNLIADGGNMPNPPLLDGSATWDDAFQVAVDAFNSHIPDNVLTLSAEHASGVAAGRDDGVNNVAFASTVFGDAWGSNTLGISISYSSGNRRVENDILFNSTKEWQAYTGSQQSRNDFRRVAIHELGHSLGLNHPDQAGQTVSAIMNSLTSNIDSLRQDDIDGVLSVYGALMPVDILQQPASITVPAGDQVSFSVSVNGSEPISYDWERSTDGGSSWSSIGAPWSNFAFTAGNHHDGHQYRVEITNPDGTVTSDVATLTVTSAAIAPEITTDPQDVSILQDEDAVFSAAASGSPTPSLQWQVSLDGGNNFSDMVEGIDGVDTTSGTMTVPAAPFSEDGNQYRCVATNSEGSATSAAATLSVTSTAEPAAFSAQPESTTVDEGATAMFTVAVTGSPSPTLQWQISVNGGASFADMIEGFAGTGTKTTTLTISSVSVSSDGNQYRCVATNSSGAVTSETVILTVNPQPSVPTVTSQPESVSVEDGAGASFDVAVSGVPSPSIQWQVSTSDGGSWDDISSDDTDFTGAMTTTLGIVTADLLMSGDQFRAVATNSEGSATSDAATLTVNPQPTVPSITTNPESTSVEVGDGASFSVIVSGIPAPSVQWQVSMNDGGSWGDISSDDTNFTGTTTTTLGIITTDLLMSGDLFRAVATNSEGSASSDAATLTVTDNSPPAPSASPAAVSSASEAMVSWEASSGATGYRVDLARDAGFTDFDSPAAKNNEDVGNVTTLDLENLPTGTWYFRVLAYNETADGEYSSTVTILINGGRMINLSTRGQTDTGSNVMIAGFAIGGSQPKQLLIRAVGPTLGEEPFNLPGTVSDTRLVVQRSAGGSIVYNETFDNWDSADSTLASATAAVGAFDLAVGSLDAAAVVMLDPGAYTAQVETVTGEPGLAIVEVYETGQEGSLVNISTRGFVGVGDAIIIPGTVISSGWKRVLVRAVGETIGQPPFGVPGVLEDPVLEVYPNTPPGAPPIVTNDNWGDALGDLASVFASVGAFALEDGSKDAALIIDLENGGYTFQVRGKDGATGVVIVELYEVP